MKNKIIAVSGSPRKGSNSHRMLLEAVSVLKENGIETEVWILSEIGIEDCCGDDECWHSGTCNVPDKTADFFYEKLLEADAFIFATPNWFNNVSSWMKKFIDRTNPIAKKRELEGKYAVILVAGDHSESANKKCESVLLEFCRIHRINVIGSVNALAEKPNEVDSQKQTFEKCKELGKKLTDEIKKEK